MTTERGITRPGEPARMPAKGRICGQQAGPDWCPGPVFSRGLCRRHYRRAARGQVLDPDDGHQVGITPSGRGTWGVVDVDADGLLGCHDCGRSYLSLAVHIGMAHDGVRAYRLRHGLPMSMPLTAEPVHRARAERSSRADYTARIAATRDPELARLAAEQDMISRGIRLTASRRRTGG